MICIFPFPDRSTPPTSEAMRWSGTSWSSKLWQVWMLHSAVCVEGSKVADLNASALPSRKDAALSGWVLHQAEGDWESAAPFCPGWDKAGFTEAVAHGGLGNSEHQQRPRSWRQSSSASCGSLWRVNRDLRICDVCVMCLVKLWSWPGCMWRWGRSSTSQTASWWCWNQSMRNSARQGARSRSRGAVTSAAFPATASVGAKRSWWGVFVNSLWEHSQEMKEECCVLVKLEPIKKKYQRSSPNAHFFLLFQFDLTKQQPSPPPPTVGTGILESGGDFDPLESPPSIDFFPDYIVTVIVPLIIAIVLCLLLAYIMFGRREGVYAVIYLSTSLYTRRYFEQYILWTFFLCVFYSQKRNARTNQ